MEDKRKLDNKKAMEILLTQIKRVKSIIYWQQLNISSVLKAGGTAQLLDQQASLSSYEVQQIMNQQKHDESMDRQYQINYPGSQQQQNSNIMNANPGTKSSSTLNSVVNLLSRDQAANQIMTNSQIMMLRGSVTSNNIQQTQNLQNPTSNRGQGQIIQNISVQGNQTSTQQQQQMYKSTKAQLYEKMIFQQNDKKNLFSSTMSGNMAPQNNIVVQNNNAVMQQSLFPRISNLRNEVTVLFKNSGSSNQNQVANVNQLQQNQDQRQNKNQMVAYNTQGNRQQVKPLSSPRQGGSGLNNGTNGGLNQHSLLQDLGQLKQYMPERIQIYQKNQNTLEQQNQLARRVGTQSNGKDAAYLKDSKNRQRLRSNHNNMGGNSKNQTAQQLNSGNNNYGDNYIIDDGANGYQDVVVDDSFTYQHENPFQKQTRQYYFSEKQSKFEHRILCDNGQRYVVKDDMSITDYSKQFQVNQEDSHQLAMTPQIMSSQSNKRHQQQNQLAAKKQQQLNQIATAGQQSTQPSAQTNQQFFSRRTGSTKETSIPSNIIQQINIGVAVHDLQTSIDQQNIPPITSLSPLNAQYQKQQELDDEAILEGKMKSSDNSPSKEMDDKALKLAQQDSAQPKIPVICGFHKRVLLLTSSVGGGQNNQAQTNALLQTRRIRNKNPNCNHNNNFVFYQPSYNNVKYDDSYKKKEEVLRKVFFKECAREDEKRNLNNQNQNNQQLKPNDPMNYLKVIENTLAASIFSEYENFQSSRHQQTSQQRQNLQNNTLMTELGLDQAIPAHKAFLLALIQSGKIISENMLKVIHEVKTSAKDFDNECIYCKYSQYALRESFKAKSSFLKEQVESNNDQQQQNQDMRLEYLVKMFQSQLFKRSFINTSLMIIQKKMNEKLLQKQKTQTVTSTQGGLDKDKPKTDLKPVKKDQPKKPNNPQQQISSLDQLGLQIQKLAKNLANPKDKEKYLELKEKYYKEFIMKINISNGAQINFPKQSFTPYKYYIGKGNNSILVRNCLKSRFWWSLGDFEEWDEYNFIWTQWKSNKILAKIKTNSEAQALAQQEAKTGFGKGDGNESLLSTQITVTDRDSTSSAETLLATPTRRKRASTLPQNQQQIQSANAVKKGGANSNSISNSASKNGNVKIMNVTQDEGTKKETSHHMLTYNHMENNFHLSNKKAIYYNMKIFYEATGQDWTGVLPMTFHIKEGPNDKEFLKFCEYFKDFDPSLPGYFDCLGKSIWIVKPGENTNRGCGIQVCRELQQIREIVSNTNVNGQKRSYIIQKYIEKPLLYKNRKFDIRCYTLLTTVNGNLQGYWYNEGYLRTSSKDFNLKNVTNRLIHLTNDAVQKKSDDYGKFESGNKLSYSDFQKYLDSVDTKCNIVKEIVPQLKKIATDTIKATSRKMDPQRRHNTFEIFGYDFMIDENLKPWLIEVNTNPCLELSAPYLSRLIPQMVENAVKIAVDPLFPPPPWPAAKKHTIPDCQDNKFELVYNDLTDAAELKNLPIDDTMNGIIEEEEMEDEGSDEEEDDGQ